MASSKLRDTWDSHVPLYMENPLKTEFGLFQAIELPVPPSQS